MNIGESIDITLTFKLNTIISNVDGTKYIFYSVSKNTTLQNIELTLTSEELDVVGKVI